MSSAAPAPPTQTTVPTRTSAAAAPVHRTLVLRQCSCGGSAGMDGECDSCRQKRLSGLMPKLVVSQPGDPFEREADRVADQVMRSAGDVDLGTREAGDDLIQTKPLDLHLTPAPTRVTGPLDSLTGVESAREEQFEGSLLQRASEEGEEEEEEEILHPKGRGDSALALDPDVEERLEGIHRGGRTLPRELQDFFGSRFGYDFGEVRIRTDAAAANLAARLRARAFTLRGSITFGPGEFAPETRAGRQLIAHELAHVVQQDSSLPRYRSPASTRPRLASTRAGTPPGAPPLQMDEEEGQDPVIGTAQFFDATGENPFEVKIRQPREEAPPGGIYELTLKSVKGDSFTFSATLPGGNEYVITLVSKLTPDSRKRMQTATKTLFVVYGTGTGATKEEEKKDKTEETGKAQGEKKAEEPTGGGGAQDPTAEEGGGGEEQREEGEETEGERKQPGSPSGTGASDKPGSKYGWLGLIEGLPQWVIDALEVALETLGDAEEYLALRDLCQNLAELDEHIPALTDALSTPEKLVEIILGLEDASLTEPIDKLGVWVMKAPEPRKPKPGGKRVKGLAAITKKVVTLLEKIRRTLQPVFRVRKQFQEILDLATAAVTAPGFETLFELASDPARGAETVKKDIGLFAKGIAETLHKEMERVQKLFALPTEALAETEFVTSQDLAIAVTRAAAKLVPGPARPFVWAAEKLNILDVFGEHLVSQLIPKALLDSINERLRSLLSEQVLEPLSKEVGPYLGDVVTEVGGLLETAAQETLEEVLIQPDGDGSGAPEDVDQHRLEGLMGTARPEPLAESVREPMEASTGFDFGRVRIHRDETAGEASRLLHAHAFTRGRDVFFAPSRYSPDTSEGRRLIAHELTHVAQQENGGPASGTVQRAAVDTAKKWIDKARAKLKAGAQSAFTPNPATAATAEKSLKALDRILGQKVVSETNPALPEGYLYTHDTALKKPKQKKGKAPVRKITGIRRKAGFVLYLPPLQIRNDRIALNLDSRLDPNAGARRALRNALKCSDKEQAHHVIPLQLQGHPVVTVAIKSGQWKLNGSDNGECLPITYHYGSHPKYTTMVENALDEIDEDHSGSTDWNVIKGDFLKLVSELKTGLQAQKYTMR